MSTYSEKSVTKPERLLWVDCEFTGLSVEEDILLEVATRVTDFELRSVASYQTFVSQNPQRVIQRMAQDNWWGNRPQLRQTMLDGVEKQGKPLAVVEQELVSFTTTWCGQTGVILAGNSLGTDRAFLSRDCPRFTNMLTYRMLDVSSFKLLVAGRHGVEIQKHEQHRAAQDIEESIAELRYTLHKLGAAAINAMP